MPASLPGATLVQNQANPTQGRCVMFDPLSGPKASPFDAKKPNPAGGAFVADIANCSTGALSTGIGFGSPPIIGPISDPLVNNAVNGIRKAGFSDNYTPGITKPDGTAATDSSLVYIGGGRMITNTGTLSQDKGRPFIPSPYDETMVALCMAGNGGSRDGGTTPFTGFPIKMVTAAGAVANGAAVEAGFVNRSGAGLIIDQSVFGSNTTPNADVV